MTSLTGGFAPIAGAGGSKDKGAAKKNDLTGGLISLHGNGGVSARSKNDDLDFSDFDVDDLLMDDAGGGSKTKTKSKNKSPSSSPKKKKSSGSSSGSSSKKKKEKEKKKSNGGALDFFNEDADDNDDWDKDDDNFGSSTKNSNKAFDLDELIAPAKKKNAKLDDEFARMLGLEDDYADRNTTMSSVTNEEGEVSEFGDSPVKRDTYAPTMARSEPVAMKVVAATLESEDVTSFAGGKGGLDASFFSDDSTVPSSKAGHKDDDFLSLLSSTSASDRRGGRGGGGRRGAGTVALGSDERGGKSLFADPFDKSERTSGPRAGGLDDLFSSSSSRGTTKPTKVDATEPEPLLVKANAPAPKSTFASLFGSESKSKTSEADEDTASFRPVPRSLSSKPPTSTINANDDLLAELFPTEAPRAASRKAPSPAKDESAQQDDLLAELFPVETKKQPRQRDPEPITPPSPPREVTKPVLEPKDPLPSPPASANTTATKRSDVSSKSAIASLADVDSARDSLLKDLLPNSPPRQVPASTRFTDNVESRFAPTQEPSPSSFTPAGIEKKGTRPAEVLTPPSKPLSPARAPLVEEPSPPKLSQPSPIKPPPPTKHESPLPSPGKTKTLALGTPSKVREVEFEQSKDDLLEEILSSAPPSPQQRTGEPTQGSANGPVSPRSRRSSYSLLLDQDAVANETRESPPTAGETARRRASRLPEKQETVASSPPPNAAPTTVTQTVFLRDVHAEEALKDLHAAAVAELVTRHAEVLARTTAETQQLESRLHREQANAAVQATVCEGHRIELQQFRDQLSEARTAHTTLMGEMQSLQTQHTLQKTQCELFDREKTALLRQVSVAEDQQRALVTQLAQEKLAHQQTQLSFADFKRETEQAAQLRTEKERAQMDRLYHQLQNSLAQLTVLQEQGTEDAIAKREMEAATRMRMISSLETTSRGYAQQTQDECHRLTSLMSSLETTLRAFRQEHLEEKERLRQEQMRLNVLAQHFQVQTSVLNEKSDANAQLLAQHLGASLQDTRAAEARLAMRRQQLADDEQKLYNERAVFASHREVWLEQRQRETAELEAQRSAIEREWRSLQREREDLEDVIASHEDAFRALQQQELKLEAEKDRVAVGALHVAEMAQKFELLTKQLVDKEHAMHQQRVETEELQRQWAMREHSVASERRKLDEREVRLHAQLKQMEGSRRKLNDERRQQLQQLHLQQRQRAETTSHHKSPVMSIAPSVASTPHTASTMGGVRAHVMHGGGNNNNSSTYASYLTPSPATMQFTTAPPRSNQHQHQHVAVTSAWDAVKTQSSLAESVPQDPSGFSPSFRQLIEENWSKQPRHTDTELRKERMAIYSLGLDTRTDRALTKAEEQHCYPTASSTMPTRAMTRVSTVSSATTTGASVSRGVTRPPPPPSSTLQGPPRVLSVQL